MWLVLRFQRSALWPNSHPALELGFCCVGLLGACFFALPHFSGMRSEIHQLGPCWFPDCFSSLQHCLTLDVAHWLRRCFCGSLFALFQAAAHHLPTVSPSVFLDFVYWKFAWRSAPCCSPSLWCTQSTSPPLLHIPFQFLVYYSAFCFCFCFCFLQDKRSVCPGGYDGLSQGWLWEYRMLFICSPVGLLDVSQAGLEPAPGSMGALLFSQCDMAWGTFVWPGGWGCRVFYSSLFFFLPSVALVSQKKFWFTELTLSASVL
jgi:hypothetical protein